VTCDRVEETQSKSTSRAEAAAKLIGEGISHLDKYVFPEEGFLNGMAPTSDESITVPDKVEAPVPALGVPALRNHKKTGLFKAEAVGSPDLA